MGRGMRVDAKLTTNLCSGLDINYLKNTGYFKEGHVVQGSITWRSWNTKKINKSVDLKGTTKAVELAYTYKNEPIRYVVEIVYSSCNYGGKRPWFSCPNEKCNKRVGKLYSAGKYFLCRHCYNLAYETQNLSQTFRLLEKAQRIRERLNAQSLATTDPFPSKPKGMHWKTYYKLKNKHDHATHLSWGMAAKAWGLVI